MAHYSGITSDLVRRKREHEREKKNVRDWKVGNNGRPFASRAAAQAWEDARPGEHETGGAPAIGPWYGYSFKYDK